MEVIEKGRKQKGWTKKYTCTGKGNGKGGCGAKLLVSASDLYHTYQHSYDGSSEMYTTFSCPLCGVETDIENTPCGISSNLPSKEDYFKKKKKED